MYSLILAAILLGPQPEYPTEAMCKALEALHELNLDQATQDTTSIPNVDYCF